MGGTPLHHGAWWGHGDVVDALLDARRGPERAWPSRASAARALGWAAHGSFHCPGPIAGGGTDHLRIAQALVQAGAEIEPDMVHAAAPEVAEWLRREARGGGAGRR